MTVKANAEARGGVCVGVMVLHDELASRGVVGDLCDIVLCRSDGFRGGSVAGPAIAPSLIQCQCELHETSVRFLVIYLSRFRRTMSRSNAGSTAKANAIATKSSTSYFTSLPLLEAVCRSYCTPGITLPSSRARLRRA